MKKIAVINDLSGFGKCSLSAALPIISANGIQCCPLPTSVFSNQTGYESFSSVDLTDHLPLFIEQWRKLSPSFDGILIGFVANAAQGKIIEDFINEFKGDNTIVVVDPIMGDEGVVYPCFDDELISTVVRLSKAADIITPNLTELCIICGEDYSSFSDISIDDKINKIQAMSKSIGKTVITTGINISDDEIGNTVFCDNDLTLVVSKKIGGSFSGTGDILSSYVTAQCVNGCDALNAVMRASELIERAIFKTMQNEKINTCDGIDFESFIKLCE